MSNSSVKFHINIVQVVGAVNIRNGRQGIKRRFEDRDAGGEDVGVYQEVALDFLLPPEEREKQGLAATPVVERRFGGTEVLGGACTWDCGRSAGLAATRDLSWPRTKKLLWNNVDSMGAFPVTPTAMNTDMTDTENSLTSGESAGPTMFSRDSRNRSTPPEGARKRKFPYSACRERGASVAPQQPPHHPITSLPTPPSSAGSSRASPRRSSGAVRITKPLPKKKRDSRAKSVTFQEQGDGDDSMDLDGYA